MGFSHTHAIDPRTIPNLPDPVTVADFLLPAQDAEGWTILTPSADSRLVYVDPVNGDDVTGTYYLPDDPAIGPDPQNPVGPVLARRTLAAAYALLRDGQADWMLLKAGGVWIGESLPMRRGRSPAERAVATAYGVGPRPELRTGTAKGISNAQMSNVIVAGIKFWAHTRDTEGPYFVDHSGSNGLSLYTRVVGDVRVLRDVLIEDCVFRAYTNNVINGGEGTLDTNEPAYRIVLRRSLISGNYSSPTSGHSQGLFYNGHEFTRQAAVLIQESVFDHNGWRVQATPENSAAIGKATIFNHNIYFSNVHGVIFDRSMFLRSSSIGTKFTANKGAGSTSGVVIQNCLYVDGEVGISIGGNDLSALRFHNIRIRDNVLSDIGRTRPTNRHLSWGLEVRDWDMGAITGNLVIHQRNTSIGNTYGIAIDATFAQRDVYLGSNIMANLHGGTNQPLLWLRDGDNSTNVLLENHTIQASTATPLVGFVSTMGGYSVRGDNRYFSSGAANTRFRIESANTNIDTWISATGDAGAVFADPEFPDPTRDVESYTAQLGLGSSFEDFIVAVYAQSRANWRPALTAAAVNDWIRAGFLPDPQQPFNSWMAGQDLPPEADTTPSGINNHAGISNLIAYALDLPPQAQDLPARMPIIHPVVEYLEITTRERVDDPALRFGFVQSNDLSDWQPVTGERTILAELSESVQHVRYRFDPPSAANPVFMRLEVGIDSEAQAD